MGKGEGRYRESSAEGGKGHIKGVEDEGGCWYQSNSQAACSACPCLLHDGFRVAQTDEARGHQGLAVCRTSVVGDVRERGGREKVVGVRERGGGESNRNHTNSAE